MQKYKFDAYSAQGRFDLARALVEGEIELTPKALEVIYACTLCGGCDVTCKFTRDMEPLEILHELRRYAVDHGKGPLAGHMSAVESIRKNNNPWLQPATRRGHWARKLEVKDLNKEKADVLYFAGCTYAYNANLQRVAQSTVRIMQRAGVDVGILGTQEGCCGSPVVKVGVADFFHETASKNIQRMNELGVTRVVTSCSGCYGVFRSHYPGVDTMNAEVIHSTELLDELIKDGKLEFTKMVPLKVTWHDPCHLGRGGEKQDLWEGTRIKWGLSDPPRERNYGSTGVFDAPRNVLKAIPGIELIEMERTREFSWCCGAGGGVKSAFPEFAMEAALERIDEANATGAGVLVTACPWCESNLSDAIAASGHEIQMVDIVELVERAL
jgi:Fe-S oxidoreductase